MPGTDLRREPIEMRKATLASILRKASHGVRFMLCFSTRARWGCARSSPPRAPKTVSPAARQLRPKLASPCTACTTILNREIRRTVVERFEGGVRRRVMARRDPAGIHLLTRNGYDWAQKYRLIVEAVNYLRERSCLIGRGGCLLQPG